MSDKLIKRLRDADIHSLQRIIGSSIFGEAADALTAAQEENERLVHDIERLSASLSAEVTGSEKLREALAFYVKHENWCINGPLDGNSPRFTGGPAKETLAALDGLPK